MLPNVVRRSVISKQAHWGPVSPKVKSRNLLTYYIPTMLNRSLRRELNNGIWNCILLRQAVHFTKRCQAMFPPNTTVHFLNVWLTVHLVYIRIMNQHDALFFTLFCYHASTCFGVIFSPLYGNGTCFTFYAECLRAWTRRNNHHCHIIHLVSWWWAKMSSRRDNKTKWKIVHHGGSLYEPQLCMFSYIMH
jgi:hypothetical protein